MSASKIIFGLGNPGKKYVNNLHNVGTLFCDYLKQKYKAEYKKSNGGEYFIIQNSENKNVAVFKSPSYMNLSGGPFKKALNLCKITNPQQNDLIVVHDDLENQFGKVKIKVGGSPSGHRGLMSIIENIKTQSFLRLKVGISRPESREPEVVAKYVLSDFSENQLLQLNNAVFEESLQRLKDCKFI